MRNREARAEFYGEDSFRGMHESVYEKLSRANHFRVAIDIRETFPPGLAALRFPYTTRV